MNMGVRFPGEGLSALSPVRVDFGGEPVDLLREADGTLWFSSSAAAQALGYRSRRVLLNRLQSADVAAELAPFVRVTLEVTSRPAQGGGSPAVLIREAGLLVLAQRMRGERGRAARRKLAEFGEAQAKRVRVEREAAGLVTERTAGAALAAVVSEAHEKVETIRKALPKGSDARALAIDVRNSLREAGDVLRVHAGQLEVGRAGWALMCRDLKRTKSGEFQDGNDEENGWGRLLAATNGRKS